jgi:lipopolysaccharide export LptBFGC system permease protein LptF
MTAVALPAMLLSLLMSGFVEPNSRFLERATLFESAYGALRSGTAAGEFHFPNGYTVFAQVADKNHPERRLFLHQVLTPTTDRLVLAKRSRLIEQQDGWFTLRLQDFTVYDFPSAAGISAGEKKKTAMQMGTMRIGDYEQELSVDRLIYFAPRNSSEQTLVELASSNSSTEIARRLFRSLLCMFAPFIALVAVALTGRATLFAALPLAIVVLMSIDISATLLLKHIAPANLGLTLAALVATAVSILAILCSQVVARQRGLLKAVLGGR